MEHASIRGVELMSAGDGLLPPLPVLASNGKWMFEVVSVGALTIQGVRARGIQKYVLMFYGKSLNIV
jgi:hypothetical protein